MSEEGIMINSDDEEKLSRHITVSSACGPSNSSGTN